MSVAGGKAEISQPRRYDDLYASNGPKMTDPDLNPFADCDFIVCYGGAKLFDRHLAATVTASTTRLSDG
jgi:hypothetical protein